MNKTTIEKIEDSSYDMSEFTEGQITFIKALVKLSYNEGLEAQNSHLES